MARNQDLMAFDDALAALNLLQADDPTFNEAKQLLQDCVQRVLSHRRVVMMTTEDVDAAVKLVANYIDKPPRTNFVFPRVLEPPGLLEQLRAYAQEQELAVHD